jgi:hypothetical protein
MSIARKTRRILASLERRMREELAKTKPNQAKLTALFRKAQELGVPGDL